jgi:hypothetical protein
MPLVSKTEFARIQGVTPPYVSKLLRTGVITEVEGKIDVDAACAAIEASSSPAHWHMKEVNAAQRKKRASPAPAANSRAKATTNAYQTARTQRESFAAKNARLDYEERSGSMVRIGSALALYGEQCVQLRTKLLAIPSERAPELFRLKTVAELQDRLSQIITEALEGLTCDVSGPGWRKPTDAAAKNAPTSRRPKPSPYLTARAEREKYSAKLRKLEYGRQSGDLIDRRMAEAVLFSEFRIARDAWMSWPSRVSPFLATDLGLDAGLLTTALDKYVHQQLTELGNPNGQAFSEDNGSKPN